MLLAGIGLLWCVLGAAGFTGLLLLFAFFVCIVGIYACFLWFCWLAAIFRLVGLRITLSMLLGTVLSTIFAVKLKGPLAVGLPVMAPVAAVNVKPPGSDPGPMENVYSCTPPFGTSAEL